MGEVEFAPDLQNYEYRLSLGSGDTKCQRSLTRTASLVFSLLQYDAGNCRNSSVLPRVHNRYDIVHVLVIQFSVYRPNSLQHTNTPWLHYVQCPNVHPGGPGGHHQGYMTRHHAPVEFQSSGKAIIFYIYVSRQFNFQNHMREVEKNKSCKIIKRLIRGV